jgi:hypothetical protein
MGVFLGLVGTMPRLPSCEGERNIMCVYEAEKQIGCPSAKGKELERLSDIERV